MTNPLYTEALDLLSRKLLEDEAQIGVAFPYVTAPSGAWETMPASASAGYDGAAWSHGNWFCGFWVGLLFAAHLHTGNDHYRKLAEERLRLVAIRAEDGNTHDIGFIFYSSAKIAFHITRDPAHRTLALQAADRLRRRSIVTDLGAYISAWGPLTDQRGRRSAAIDTMANIPLLYWAATAADDDSFRLAGEAHAMTTQRAFLREDDSTFHAVEFALPGGDRTRGFTFQGYADTSCWSRGQAWAIYGFVATFAATGKPAYLAQAERLAEYWWRRVGEDPVPYWDFDDPTIPDAPRDSAAAAITASALLDLAQLHHDPAAAQLWRSRAHATLDRLCRNYLARDPAHRGLLMHGCYSKPHGIGADAAVLFGDFYFAEALCTAVMPGRFKPLPACPHRQRST
jgi:unsaturated chondroitin disaccharide hydrolase